MKIEIFDIIKFLGGLSIGGISIYYVLKLALNKFMEAGLENYKAKLGESLETHKAELTRITQENKIKFEYLHQQRVETIKGLHDTICSCEDALQHLTTIAQGAEWTKDQEREKRAMNKLTKLERSIRASRLYLNEDLCDRLDDLYKLSWNIVLQMKFAKNREEMNIRDYRLFGSTMYGKLEGGIDDWTEANKKVEQDYRKNRIEIENEFKKMLGESYYILKD